MAKKSAPPPPKQKKTPKKSQVTAAANDDPLTPRFWIRATSTSGYQLEPFLAEAFPGVSKNKITNLCNHLVALVYCAGDVRDDFARITFPATPYLANLDKEMQLAAAIANLLCDKKGFAKKPTKKELTTDPPKNGVGNWTL